VRREIYEVPVECVVERIVERDKPIDHYIKVAQFVPLENELELESPAERIVKVKQIMEVPVELR
jgi:hypothetical protein